MFKIPLFVLFGGFFVFTSGVPFEDCMRPGDSSYELLTVEINQCKQIPCKLKVGTMANVTAVYDRIKSNTFKSLVHNTHWIINNQKVKTNVLPPLLEDPKHSYSAQIEVHKDLPPVRGELFWQVTSNSNEVVICFKVPVAMVYKSDYA